jgi:hypothetical protein
VAIEPETSPAGARHGVHRSGRREGDDAREDRRTSLPDGSGNVPDRGTRRLVNWRTRGSSLARAVAVALLFAAAFFAVQRLTFALRFPPVQRSTIWTPGALLFAALLLAPPRRWWVYYVGLCLGVFAAFYGDHALTETSVLSAAQLHFATIATGVWIMRRYGAGSPFGSTASVLAFVPVALVLVPVLTIAPDGLLRYFSGADDVWPVAVRSVFAIALGLLIASRPDVDGGSWFKLAPHGDAASVLGNRVPRGSLGGGGGRLL